MKKTLLTLFIALIGFAAQAQTDIPYTELNYNVHYHWGMIDVAIAHGVVTVQKSGDSLTATLDGNSVPWNGRIFCVSDTLRASLTPSSESISYINGWYMKPKVSVYRGGSFNPSDPAFYKNIKGQGELDASSQTMEAVTITADMLALYYYFRVMDFPNMSDGQSVSIPISSPGGSDSVLITYHGRSTLDIGGSTYHTYRVSFEYSYRGRMSGYPVETEVAADSRIPLRFSANLPVGHVQMTYDE